MTVLPVMERELRSRARNRATYWSRFGVALGGGLMCLPPLMFAGPFTPPGTLGSGSFKAAFSAALLLSFSACLGTADLISSERREGTLGLLLLTRVKARDVLLGKLGSAALTSFCALAAFLPLFIVPVLLGGVKGDEVCRRVLVLFDVLFLALAAGLWGSSGQRERFKAAAGALGVLALITLVPLLIHSTAGPGGFAHIGAVSPLVLNQAAAQSAYALAPKFFWTSLAAVHAASWLLLASAAMRLRHAVRPGSDVDAVAPADLERPASRRRWASAGEEASPVAWLVRRQSGVSAALMAGAVVSVVGSWAALFVFRFWGLAPMRVSWVLVSWLPSLATGLLHTALFAWAASRFFFEARRSGELELLLTTPVGAKTITAEQWRALKRMLRWPLVVLLVPLGIRTLLTLTSTGTQMSFGFGAAYKPLTLVSMVLGFASVLFSIGALCWMAMWFGLRARRQASAIVWSVVVVWGAPYLVNMFGFGLFRALIASSGWGQTGIILGWMVPTIATILFHAGLMVWARRRLLDGFPSVEPVSFDLRRSLASGAREAVRTFQKARHWTPSQRQ